MPKLPSLSRRERELMDIVFSAGAATASEIRSRMASPPSYSAVRATLRILETKGLLRHEEQGRTYVFRPTVKREKARDSAVEHLLDTFFEGRAASAVMALLERSDLDVTDDDFDRMARLIARARKEGR